VPVTGLGNHAAVGEQARHDVPSERLGRHDEAGYRDDAPPGVRAVTEDFRTLDTTPPPVDAFPPLLLIVGILVVIYGVAMLSITSTIAPSSEESEPEA